VGSISEKVACSERGKKIQGARGIRSVEDRWNEVREGIDMREVMCMENIQRGG
jgi:hypothetical protein